MLLVLGLIEIGAVLLLSLWGIFDPGPGGLNLQPYNITHAPSANAFYLAVVFSIFGISGWEAAAPLAEEARDPRKTVPKALVLAVVFMMLFFSVCSYGLMIGSGYRPRSVARRLVHASGAGAGPPVLGIGLDHHPAGTAQLDCCGFDRLR